MVRNLPAMRKTQVLSLGWEESSGEGNGYPLQYPCLENSRGRGALVGYGPWGHRESNTAE